MTLPRRITAYGLLHGASFGGPIRHGEHPASAVVRLFAEQAGLAVVVSRVLDVSAVAGPDGHEDRVRYEMVPARATRPPVPRSEPKDVAGLIKRQRFAAYGYASDPDGRILLTRISSGFPGGGRWHLPGGGTDPGEQPTDALLRELYEETGQRGEITALLGVTHRRNPAALGPEGHPINWHAVRALYRVLVPVPDQPRVTEAAGGSTADAAWFAPGELAALDLTEVVQWAVSHEERKNDVHR